MQNCSEQQQTSRNHASMASRSMVMIIKFMPIYITFHVFRFCNTKRTLASSFVDNRRRLKCGWPISFDTNWLHIHSYVSNEASFFENNRHKVHSLKLNESRFQSKHSRLLVPSIDIQAAKHPSSQNHTLVIVTITRYCRFNRKSQSRRTRRKIVLLMVFVIDIWEGFYLVFSSCRLCPWAMYAPVAYGI